MTYVKKRISCEKLLRNLTHFPLPINTVISLLLYTAWKNLKIPKYTAYIWDKHDPCVPDAELTSYQKDVYCAGPKLYSALPANVKVLNHDVKYLSQHWKIIS